jgi:aspartate/methionine/tyrosine aminotransferase
VKKSGESFGGSLGFYYLCNRKKTEVMKETPIKREIVDKLIAELGINDFAKATIREVKQVAAKAEKESGVEFIKMEMGIPGLPAAQVGVDAQVKALQGGIAHSYPDIQGAPVLKQEASRFVKAFIGLDVAAECCVPVTGSMQGTFASFLTCSQADKRRDTVLFIDPGFPVQKMQLQVMGVKYETFDVYDYRGDKLGPKVESYLRQGNICAIVYSNPNNPAWICLNEQELQAIGELATKYDAIVMEDLAYFAMDFRQNLSVPFQPPYQPSVGRYTDNYMLLISGSKAFSYAGERIGVVCISNKLFHRHYDDLAQRYEGLPFGLVFSTRMLYALSSGTSHSAQYALAAMLKAATDGDYDFRKEVSVYGDRAHKLKEIFLRHGFHIVYDKDLDQPVADGFYFTIGYKKMTSGELAKELMYYGVSAICLITTGSHQEGLRVCTSFIEDHQYAQLDERMQRFEENNP